MSYEKMMKDLMERLVSMSPEPPPYPEEVTMATQVARRRSRPVLAFVGAAVLVALLAVPVILLTGGDPTVADTTTTTTSPIETTTTLPLTTTTLGDEPTETTVTTLPAPSSLWTGLIYLIQTPENSFRSNPALVPVVVEIEAGPGVLDEGADFTAGLSAIAGRELPGGLMNVIPADVQVVEQRVENGVVIAEMSETFLNGAGGALADFTMLNQLIYTLTQADPTMMVLFTVGGEPVEAFGSEGLGLTEPVGREDFIDHLAPIFLTEPLLESETEYTVTGMSNVFEANVNLAVLDAEGQITFDFFTTAACGTGCWGEFSEDIPADLITPGESSISVFTHSMEDDSAIDVVTVPIPEDWVWRIGIED